MGACRCIAAGVVAVPVAIEETTMAANRTLSRRRLLGLHRTAPDPRSVGRPMVFRPQDGPAGDVLVCVFLRGGADGLHLVAPYGDTAYYSQRPRIAVPRPDDSTVPADQRGVRLDSFFTLSPALSSLHEAYHAGHLAII